MDKRWLAFALTLAGVSLEVLGDTLLKKWSIDANRLLLIAGFALYAVGSILWLYSLRYDEFTRIGFIFTILNALGFVVIGTLYFHEGISANQKIGIALGLIAVFLMEW